jgi:NAD(P)-dependent dehydrogenase (short-subunit alcohol dehydrogenase family)
MKGRRVALITGAASGIGAAVARWFAAADEVVVAFDLNKEGVEDVVAQIEMTGGEACSVVGDVCDRQALESAVQTAVDSYGGLDVLVSAAGIPGRHTALEISDDEWDRIIEVNLTGTFNACRAAIPALRSRGGGAIVIVASAWGLVAGPRAVAYCAAKGGVVNLTRALAIDHGPARIRVNCVCPGDIDTPLLRAEYVAVGLDPEVAFVEAANGRPVGRVGVPEDVAAAVGYLASAEAGYVTGSALAIDGGWLAGG